jgi:prophage regulatory protein
MPTQNRFIDRSEVERRVSLRRERIRQLETLGKFPRRIRLSARRNVWVESEIDQWIADRIADARTGGDHA